MKRSFAIVLVGFLLLTMSTMSSSANESTTQGPFIDDLYIVAIENAETAVASLRTGEIQGIIGLQQPEAIYDLIADGYRVIMPTSFGQQFITMNCKIRPTSDTNFRRALAHLFPKEYLVETYLGPAGDVAHSALSRAFGPYYNPEVTRYDYDPEQAQTILDNAGFTVDSETGIRIDPTTGQPLEPITLLYRDIVPFKYVAPRFATEMRNVNIPVDDLLVDRNTWINRVLLERSYHIEVQGGQEARVPGDYLYQLYHSDNDVEWGYNWAGVLSETEVQSQLDELIETSLYSLNEATMIDATLQIQEILADYVPRIPFYDIRYPTAYVPELMGIMDYPQFLDSHLNELRLQYRSGAGGIVRIAHSIHGDTLSVLSSRYAISRWMVGLVTDGAVGMGVVGLNPYTYEAMPWIAVDWNAEPWEAAPGVAGQKTTIWLKEGILWHDNVEFTANDIEFALWYLQNKQVPGALKIWQPLVDINVVNPYQIEIYHNTTSLFMIRLLNEYMATIPKHVWNDDVTMYGEPAGLSGIQDGYDYGVGDPLTFRPWEVSHPSVSGLTCLIGTGPFIFKDGVWGDYLHFEANRDYFKRMLLTDINIDFKVNIIDISTTAKAFATTPGDARWNVIADVNGDSQVNIIDIATIAKDFGKVW